MELVLTEQQSLLRDTATKLAAATGGAKRARKLREAGTEIDADAWRAVIDAGLLGTVVREEHGGLGLGAFDLALAIEEMGKQLLMVPLAEAAAAAWALSQADGSGTAAATLGDILSAKQLIVPAIAAPAWGYTASGSGMRSSAQEQLDGSIEHVPFAAMADAFLVDAETAANSRSLCIASRANLAVTTRHNVDGSTSSRVAASAARIDGVVTHGDAARISSRMQDLLVLWTAVELLGVAQAAHDMTTEYLKLRKQFGKPIGSFQALQHRMVDCFVDIELNRSLLYRVLAAWDSGEQHPAFVSAAKSRISRSALATVRTAVQLHGAMGYTDEHDIGLFYKRAVALAAKYGNEIMHADQFSALTLAYEARRP